MRENFRDTEQLALELGKIKDCFDAIYELYDEIQDDFRVTFHCLQKDTFVEYLDDEAYDEYFK